ncbi:MAG: glycosyltransferase family 39 protein [Candidatus Limiplasma sp.]|nr:glycosyltransferase family 39 protein [Candidatus Limiplasma sp.]MEA5146292.1 glycosyltransferase family 39 protein [Candidatus Limiplasma sp.]
MPTTRRVYVKIAPALPRFVSAVLLLLIGFLLFSHLGDMFIVDYDEARHGVSAYEMLRSGDYVVSTYQGEPDLWNLKPPLSFWLISLGYRLLGYNALGLRFFSALAALAAALLLWHWTTHSVGHWAGVFVLLCIAANATVYGLHFARFGDADSQYQFFFTVAMLCLLRSDADVRWLYGSAFAFGFAFLEKGAHAFTIAAVCLLALLATGRFGLLGLKRLVLLVLAGLTPILPWAISRYLRDGFTFFRAMVTTDVVARSGAASDITGVGVGALAYYLQDMAANPVMLALLGISGLCALVLCVTQTRLTRPQRNAAITAALWLAVPLLLYTLANAKFRWYQYSYLYAAPVLTAVLLSRASGVRGWHKPLAVVMTAAVLGFGVLTVRNVQKVTHPETTHTVQAFLRDQLDRDMDAGRHAYIQYNENQQTTWMQGGLLTALLYGDVLPLDGGVDAYLADEESAVLFVARAENQPVIDQLYETEIVRNETDKMVAFEK